MIKGSGVSGLRAYLIYDIPAPDQRGWGFRATAFMVWGTETPRYLYVTCSRKLTVFQGSREERSLHITKPRQGGIPSQSKNEGLVAK